MKCESCKHEFERKVPPFAVDDYVVDEEGGLYQIIGLDYNGSGYSIGDKGIVVFGGISESDIRHAEAEDFNVNGIRFQYYARAVYIYHLPKISLISIRLGEDLAEALRATIMPKNWVTKLP